MRTLKQILFLCVFFTLSGLAAAPIADFSLSVTQGCVPLTVGYTDKSTGSGLSYLWDFGNGNTSTLKNPSAIYYQSGNFKVKLTVTDANGNKSSKTFTPIRVFSNPTARFNADTVACIGDNLLFTDQSVKADTTIVKWTWDFGDGNLGTGSAPRHPYTYSSRFSIGLTVTDANGCKSLLNKSNYIRIKPSPKASFKVGSNYSCMLPGVFTATNTSTGSNTYKWICSDGSTATTSNYTTSITSFGTYTLKLVASSGGCSDTAVFKPLIIEKLVARFGLDGPVCEGSDYQFKNSTTPNNKAIKYRWDFGDGGTDTARQPKHVYTSQGKFTVKLSVSNGTCSDSMTQSVTVYPVPDVRIAVQDSIGCKSPFKAIFNIVGSNYSSSLWDFGDKSNPQNFSAGSPITHNYVGKGAYSVKVKVSNSYGCVADLKLNERIQVAQQWVDIQPEKFYDCLPVTKLYNLNKNIVQPIASITWTFGDSMRNYSGEKVNKHFEKAGNFLAIVVVKTFQGCEIRDTALISVGNRYVPTFKLRDYHVCGMDTLRFINTTADSIKKRVRFSLKAEPLFPADTWSYVRNDSILVTRRGGIHLIKMTAQHFGCETESEMTDTVYAHGPYVGVEWMIVSCKLDKIAMTPSYSWGNRYDFSKDDTMKLPYDQGKIYSKFEPNYFVFKGWNDTFGCFDSVRIPNRSLPTPYHVDASVTLNQNCAPAKGFLSASGDMKKYKWLLPNGDSSLSAKTTYNFTKTGNFKILLIGTYDSTNCPDTNEVTVNIAGVKLRSSVKSNGKCSPVNISLYDSTAGTDNNYHTWKVNGKVIEAKSLLTELTISSIPPGDSLIRIEHKVASPAGCTSVKQYTLPYSGPVASYKVQRFAICDTPVFYFKSYIDSTYTKYPVTYQWKMSSGLTVNTQNMDSKFKQMGMNYFVLTITDRENCRTTYNDSFEVSPNMLQPLFKADPTGRFCPPLQCKFEDMSKSFSAGIKEWEWDFGDGSTSKLQNPQKLYLVPGSYNISLKITSVNGCTAVLKKPGYIIVNGPRGSYNFDRGNSCLPHTVQFRGKTLDSATMEWDLGDGVVRQGNGFKHVYRQAGRYIPAMILSDTLGCKYTLPPIDTIYVYDYPEAKFTVDGLCFHQPMKISNQSVSHHENPQLKSSWLFNDAPVILGTDSSILPQTRGWQTIRLVVENGGTCKDTAERLIRIYAPESDFSIADKHTCLGMPLSILNTTKSDTSVIRYDWDFGDGQTASGSSITHQYSKSGTYTIQLIAEDKMGCLDTIVKPNIAVIGDTISPIPVPIRRATVLGDHKTELVIAKHPNFDFTNYSIYKSDNNKFVKFAEITNVDDTVFTDHQVNTLHQSYCYKVRIKNLCQMVSDISLSSPHCTVETEAKGILEANQVRWSAYVGFDSIARYEIWRAEGDRNSAYRLIDSVDGDVLTYTDTHFTCYTSKYYRIKAIQKGGFKEYSNSDTARAKPYYINTTKPNYAWRATVENNDDVRLEWLNNAWSKHGIRGYLVDKYFADGNRMFQNKYFDASDTVLNDAQVKVNEKSYYYVIRGVDNCNDTTPWSNLSQSILLKGYFDVATQKPAVSWNAYREWDQGIAYYEVERKQADGSFKAIGKVARDQHQFIDQQAESTCVPDYIYRVRAVSNWHVVYDTLALSYSNEVKVLPRSTLFVPNAFSPDRNGINEVFGGKGQYIARYKIEIYNRWGEKVFESGDCLAGWDGFYKGEQCQQDVYLYHIEALGADNKWYNLKGTFTLLR